MLASRQQEKKISRQQHSPAPHAAFVPHGIRPSSPPRTRSRTLHPISAATRAATDIAATRRGWVHPMRPRSAYPASSKYLSEDRSDGWLVSPKEAWTR